MSISRQARELVAHLCDEAAAAHAETLAWKLDGAALITFAVTAGLSVLMRVGRGGRVGVVGSNSGHGGLAIALKGLGNRCSDE